LKNISRILTVSLALSAFQAHAGPKEREKAYILHNRLTGVPGTNAVLDLMEASIVQGNYEAAAEEAIKNKNFYNVTLKNWVKSWSNRDQNPRVEFNDFVATVVGMIRDSGTKDAVTNLPTMPFDQVLYGDILYKVNGQATAYAANSNDHYRNAENAGANLMTDLVRGTQSGSNNLPADAIAGVMTTRTAGENYYQAGTNRRMNRYMFINFLCKDYEELHDISIPDNHVERDVERNPGGDSRTYLNKCVGCHAGQDALRGAHAYYDFNNGAVTYSAGAVVGKITRVNSFSDGKRTINDSWTNTWAQGKNASLGWRTVTSGNGAKSLGRMLARSRAFSVCMANKVFKQVCIKDAKSVADKSVIESLATSFEAGQEYNMKKLFVKTSAGCVANE
jgi:hypothetical protein